MPELLKPTDREYPDVSRLGLGNYGVVTCWTDREFHVAIVYRWPSMKFGPFQIKNVGFFGHVVKHTLAEAEEFAVNKWPGYADVTQQYQEENPKGPNPYIVRAWFRRRRI